MTQLDPFTQAYVEAALGTTRDDRDPGEEAYLDEDYTRADFDPDTLDEMRDDCREFQRQNAETLRACRELRERGEWKHAYPVDELAGHDFWMTRQHLGSGFWDGDWPEPHATELDNAARTYKETVLYVGDDGKIHAEPH